MDLGCHGFPMYSMLPLSNPCIPENTDVTVDFPDPFSPISPRISPRLTQISTLSRATTGPKVFVIEDIFITVRSSVIKPILRTDG